VIGGWVAGGLALVAALAVGATVVQTRRVESAKAEAAVSAEAAKANQAVVEALQADAAIGARLSEELHRYIADLEQRKQEVIREIVEVPIRTECVGSPAVGLALQRLRAWPHTAADGRSPPAARAGAAVPAAPGAGPARQR